MTLNQLKESIVKDSVDIFETQTEKDHFENDIFTAENVWEIQWTLQGYGWDKQDTLDIIFKHLIED